jgi:ABC-2 type transport system ATP-binding protein
VSSGTGVGANIGRPQFGKTGTAQTAEGEPPHAWFVAFAPAEDQGWALGDSIRVLGKTPGRDPDLLGRVGFVAQDAPLYGDFTGAELLRLGAELNRRFDLALALDRLGRLGVPLDRRVDRLSGGQRAQVALAIALAKRPELLLLDEPVASLDPLARREFLQVLMGSVAEQGLTVLLSSHLLADLERVCDYLIVLQAARVQLLGPVDELLEQPYFSAPLRKHDCPPISDGAAAAVLVAGFTFDHGAVYLGDGQTADQPKPSWRNTGSRNGIALITARKAEPPPAWLGLAAALVLISVAGIVFAQYRSRDRDRRFRHLSFTLGSMPI